MTDRYQKIRDALSQNPTPGPWAACHTNSGTFVKSERLAGYFVEVRHCRTAQDVNADAHLIAACDPDTIRELLAERDALAAEAERLAEALRELEEREQRDEALLRQALEALEQIATDLPWELTGLQADTIAALSAALAEPTCKQSLQVAEQRGPEHISSPDCWCHPELDYKDPDTGAEVWVHRSMQ